MSLVAALNTRESGQDRLRDRSSLPTDFILEDFRCLRNDEFCMEAQLDEEVLLPPFACRFSTVPGKEHLLAVADEDGCVRLFDTNVSGEKSLAMSWLPHQNAVFDIAWVYQENKLLTASGDQTIVLWDVLRKERLAIFKGHCSSVKVVSYQHNSKEVFASGSRDGHVMVWDSRCSSKDGSVPAVNVIHNAHMCHETGGTSKFKKRGKALQEASQQSVTAVMFQDNNMLVSAGAVDGIIKVWDLRKNYTNLKSRAIPAFYFPYAGTSKRKHGFSGLCMDSSRTRLFASCMDDIIYEYSCASFKSQPVNTYRGHRNSSFYVKACVSPNDQYLLSGSSDDKAHIWQISGASSSVITLQGHESEVTDVVWCPTDMSKIVTASDDNTMRIWRVQRGPCGTESGDVIGNAYKPASEKGVSTACLQSSSIIRYPSIISNNTSLPSTSSRRSSSPGSTKQVFKSPNYKLPSIARWPSPGTNLQEKLASPCKKVSPRKLSVILSPRKTISFNESGVQVIDALSPIKYGVKRKLESNENTQQSKKMCNILQNSTSGPSKRSVFTAINQDALHSRGTYPHIKKLFVDHMMIKEAAIPPSPTSNLPNYVLNPEPRSVHLPVVDKENSPKKLDWLTRLMQTRREGNDNTGNVTNDQSPRSRPVSPVGKSPLPRAKSILSYFSLK